MAIVALLAALWWAGRTVPDRESPEVTSRQPSTPITVPEVTQEAVRDTDQIAHDISSEASEADPEPPDESAVVEEAAEPEAPSRIQAEQAADEAEPPTTPSPDAADQIPPVLAIDAAPTELSLETVVITGRVMDDGGVVTLSVNSETVDLAEDGSFGVRLPLQAGRNVLLFVATDEASNQTIRSMEISGPVETDQTNETNEKIAGVDSSPALGPPSGRFRDHGDATIHDTLSGITWSKRPTRNTVSLKEAKSHCRKLELARQSDWMLPTIEELEELSRAAVQLAEEGRPTLALAALNIWSSSRQGIGQPWIFDFATKNRRKQSTNDNPAAVRALCVRRQPRPREQGAEPGGPRPGTPPPRKSPN